MLDTCAHTFGTSDLRIMLSSLQGSGDEWNGCYWTEVEAEAEAHVMHLIHLAHSMHSMHSIHLIATVIHTLVQCAIISDSLVGMKTINSLI
jgi:hypothetical protein